MIGRLFTCCRCGKQTFISDENDGRNITMPMGWNQFVIGRDDNYTCPTCTAVFNEFLNAFFSNRDFSMPKYQAPDTYAKHKSVEIIGGNANGPEHPTEELNACSADDACPISWSDP